ncbi:MAG: hypothetical protein SYC29_16720 [Planctomycetota bacterium]|nr:hypothetical protein [Planctomycetota bacterium]
MRLILDTLVALMLVGILAGLVMHHRQAQDVRAAQDLARDEVRRFQQQIHLHTALSGGEQRERGYPVSIEPDWFQGNLPVNPLLGRDHPWLEVAGPGATHALHPTDLVAADRDSASFWYNPATGVVRARVPVGVSDAQALELYNYVNDCTLPTLFPDP